MSIAHAILKTDILSNEWQDEQIFEIVLNCSKSRKSASLSLKEYKVYKFDEYSVESFSAHTH